MKNRPSSKLRCIAKKKNTRQIMIKNSTGCKFYKKVGRYSANLLATILRTLK